MAGLLAERHREEGVPDIRMYISDRQPHTVSLLVLGDVELALRTGQFRDVRVVMVVEAATAEPGGDDVRVRVVHAGLVSARREVLVATYRFLSVLRQQHRSWIGRPEMGGLHRDYPQVFAPDGAILPRHRDPPPSGTAVSYTHLRAHET